MTDKEYELLINTVKNVTLLTKNMKKMTEIIKNLVDVVSHIQKNRK